MKAHYRKRNEFIQSVQSSAQIYSYASSSENTECKGTRGKMGKTREITGKSKKQDGDEPVPTSSSSVNHPIASKRRGILKASTGEPDARATRNSKPDAASSSQGRLKDANLGATDKSKESWEFSESESWCNHKKEVTGKPVASRSSENSGNSKAGSRKWPHNFQRSPA